MEPRAGRTRPSLRRILLVLLALFLSTLAVLSVFALSMGTGSTWRAGVWKDRLASVTSPEDARRKFDCVETLRFSDGTWMILAAESSHGDPFGGTVVAKDSHGVIRAFYGHVCGSSLVKSDTLPGAWQTLERHYATSPDGWPAKQAERDRATKERNARDAAQPRR